MKKYLYHILWVFLLLSCTDDNLVTTSTDITEGEKANFTFSVNVPATSQVTTRSSMNQPGIDNLYLVVFDEQGTLKELAEAKPVSSFGVESEVEYGFNVTLTQTEEKRYIHFIANYFTDEILADFSWGHEWDIIPTMTVSGGQDAYWQRIELDGIYGEGSSRHETTIAQMARVPLIRNYAKITMVNEQKESFLLEGFVVVNTLNQGSVAPYNTNNGNFVNYVNEDKEPSSYGDITGETAQNYVAFEPEEAQLNINIPTDFTTNEKYLYERHHRNGNVVNVGEGEQTFVLVKGKYDKNGQGDFGSKPSTYYKVDLVFMQQTDLDGNGSADLNLPRYHNILRNFEYRIRIQYVINDGYASPEEAASKVAGNNLLGSTETRPYTNISDEEARIFVEYTDKTVVLYNNQTEIPPFTLKYKYYPEFEGTNSQMANDKVKLLLGNPATGMTKAIESTSNQVVEDDWSTITITPYSDDLGTEVRKQTLMLYVTDDENNNLILSRDVDITVRKALNMDVRCNPSAIDKDINEALDVNIYIPTQMDPLIFPLDFIIEAEKASIYPNHNDTDGYMPVNVGASLAGSNQNETTVRYVKTLTWETYKTLSLSASNGQVCIRCPFLTNKEESASKIYVQNTYFNLGVASFSNN